jgi:ribose 1,5-bisphosphokinase PhnN
MFFGYGGPDHRLDRETVQHQWESTIMKKSEEITLVHVTADSDVIKQRMQDDPHENMVITEGDIERVKSRFAELVDWSTIKNKIVVDNSGSLDDTLADFIAKIQPFLTEVDHSRMKERSS